MRLTSSKGKLEDGRSWTSYDILGKRVRVIDDFENAMLVDEMIHDRIYADDEKTAILLSMVLPDPQSFADAFGDDTGEAFSEVMWQAFGLDILGKHNKDEVRVLSWDEDGARIIATMRMTYGLGPDEFGRLSYREICDLIGMSPHETPMGQALYYRLAERPERNKYNSEEVDAFDRAREFYRLGSGGDEDANMSSAGNDAATSMFEAMKRRAKSGG